MTGRVTRPILILALRGELRGPNGSCARGRDVPRTMREALIGRDHDPYNRASAHGEYGKGVRARGACRTGSEVR